MSQFDEIDLFEDGKEIEFQMSNLSLEDELDKEINEMYDQQEEEEVKIS